MAVPSRKVRDVMERIKRNGIAVIGEDDMQVKNEADTTKEQPLYRGGQKVE